MSDGIRFYDVHCHAMNLSHPNFVLFVKRLMCAGTRRFADVQVFLHLVRLACQRTEKNNRVLNLVSVMERDTGEFLQLMEKDLRKLCDEARLHVDGGAISQVVLTPLMVDFGRKDLDGSTYRGIHYNTLSRKPIRDQVDDLFDGIRDYRDCDKKNERFLEIFPFLGLNTANYDLDGNDDSIGLKDLLHKYFSMFTKGEGDRRREMLSECSGSFKEKDRDEEKERDKSYSCAGIKVYPPLGFDPWPAAGVDGKRGKGIDARKKRDLEQKKVEYLYRFCVEKNIPITVHCNDGGFMSGNVPLELYTAPSRWKPVLEKFPGLKLNLAHFGRQDRWCSRVTNCMGLSKAWQDEIVELMLDTKKNVYSDFSFVAASPKWYAGLKTLLKKYQGEKREQLQRRILFGSDFMINLLATDSYEKYVGMFLEKNGLDKKEKLAFCSTNPEQFLFGPPVEQRK